MASYLPIKQAEFNFIEGIVVFVVLFLILWDPIQIFILKIDGAGRIPNIISLIGLLFISGSIKNILSDKAVKIYLVLSLYMFLNAIYKGSIVHFYDSYIILFFTIFRQQFLMWMIIYLCKKNLHRTLLIIALGYFIYTLICAVFGANTMSGRLGGEIDSNNIGIQSCFAVGFIILYQLLNFNNIKLFRLILFLTIPIVTIIQTGSRTAFIILFLLLFGLFFFYSNKRSISQVLISVVVLVLLFLGTIYIFNNTILGERLAVAHTQMEGYTGTVFDKLGDRGPQYVFAWPIILDNFITGIGLRNYISVGTTGLVLHSEILVQLCENGIIGLFLFILFYYILYKKILKSRRLLKKGNEPLLANTFSMIFYIVSFIIAFVMWSYSFTFSFSLFGVLIAQTNLIKNNMYNSYNL